MLAHHQTGHQATCKMGHRALLIFLRGLCGHVSVNTLTLPYKYRTCRSTHTHTHTKTCIIFIHLPSVHRALWWRCWSALPVGATTSPVWYTRWSAVTSAVCACVPHVEILSHTGGPSCQSITATPRGKGPGTISPCEASNTWSMVQSNINANVNAYGPDIPKSSEACTFCTSGTHYLTVSSHLERIQCIYCIHS